MMTDRPTFWMVYGLQQRAPVFRHKTEADAVEEATRLARCNPGVEFFVLESTHHVVKRDVDVTRIGHALERPDYGDGIPF